MCCTLKSSGLYVSCGLEETGGFDEGVEDEGFEGTDGFDGAELTGLDETGLEAGFWLLDGLSVLDEADELFDEEDVFEDAFDGLSASSLLGASEDEELSFSEKASELASALLACEEEASVPAVPEIEEMF